MRDFLIKKIEKNAACQSTAEDSGRISPLVSSVAISYLIFVQKVPLTPEEYEMLFSSLTLHADQKEGTCSEFDRLLKHFPSEHWQ